MIVWLFKCIHLPLYISLVTERNVCDSGIIFVLIFQSWKINLLYYLHVIIREPIFPNKLNGKTGNLFCRLSKCHHHTIYRVCLADHDVKRKPTQNNSGIVGSSCQWRRNTQFSASLDWGASLAWTWLVTVGTHCLITWSVDSHWSPMTSLSILETNQRREFRRRCDRKQIYFESTSPLSLYDLLVPP